MQCAFWLCNVCVGSMHNWFSFVLWSLCNAFSDTRAVAWDTALNVFLFTAASCLATCSRLSRPFRSWPYRWPQPLCNCTRYVCTYVAMHVHKFYSTILHKIFRRMFFRHFYFYFILFLFIFYLPKRVVLLVCVIIGFWRDLHGRVVSNIFHI